MTQKTMLDIRAAMVGDTGVGKSSLALKYTADQFNIDQPSTSGAQFIKKNLVVDGKPLKF